MRKRMIFCLCAVLFAAIFISCGGTKIDYRMNVTAPDTNNYFSWSAPGVSVTDRFDAATGASKARSTERFDQAITFDTPESAAKYADVKDSYLGYTLPSGLRGLFMFALAADATRVNDHLDVTANGKQLTIRYVHRDSAYKIVTDVKGGIDVTNTCMVMRDVASADERGLFTLKPEFSTTGAASANMGDFDWSAFMSVPDVFGPNASRYYTGVLPATFDGSVLTIKGELKEVK